MSMLTLPHCLVLKDPSIPLILVYLVKLLTHLLCVLCLCVHLGSCYVSVTGLSVLCNTFFHVVIFM